MVRLMRGLLVGAVLVIGTILVVLYFAGEIGGPVLYLLPGEYRGWVGIRYNDPHCSPLRKEGWYTVVLIGANGRGCTSSSVPEGWRYVRYEYFYPDGKRRNVLSDYQDIWPIGVSGPTHRR
jgi:hypothetical protein